MNQDLFLDILISILYNNFERSPAKIYIIIDIVMDLSIIVANSKHVIINEL